MGVKPRHIFTIVLLVTLFASATWAAVPESSGLYRQWIEEMKANPRGPFSRLRWFCNDGTLHPPKPYPCAERGGGHQHGEWSERTKKLRSKGYKVANLLAGLDAKAFVGGPDFLDTYHQILVEKYLIGADDGWILRRALFYRGAIQEEDERASARNLLLALSAKPEWTSQRYPALRLGAAMLPHGEETASVQKVRQVSMALSERDPGFMDIRVKIHGTPDGSDAKRVRDYAAKVSDPELKAKYEELAQDIDSIYQAAPLPTLLEETAGRFSGDAALQRLLREAAENYRKAGSDEARYRVSAGLLAALRDSHSRVAASNTRLDLLDLRLAVESDNFRTSVGLRETLPGASRQQRVQWLAAALDAAYGTGVINARQRTELKKALDRLDGKRVRLETYLGELGYLGQVPGWGTQGLRFYFFESMQKLSEVEPLSLLFIQDQLRGSPLLFYSLVLDSLLRDANRLAGVKHKLFGEEVGVGFRALNPGLARGTLHTSVTLDRVEAFQEDGIYLLPETVAELPPVAGILTAGEGNPLSHVQLLARNLGIPNVAVDEALVSRLRAHEGQKMVLAVSPAGIVELEKDDDRWDAVFGQETVEQEVLIKPDLEKLDLSKTDFVKLEDLRAEDSGRIVGPKAAKLGELRHHYPEAVARGVAIPFGVFRETVLEKPYKGTGKTVFQWMVANYDQMQRLPEGSGERREFTERFRSELYALVLRAQMGQELRQRLRAIMQETFGKDGSYGVFVRSDTNVEDLPGFTGAGLNLTVPNVVGFDQLVEAIPRVWASPFTARAFAWRQSHMADPEHVYPAILLLESVPTDKSGVLVTQDVDSGDRKILSLAVNEGVGEAVDGQAAESLRIDTRDGSVRVMATATAPWRDLPNLRGGVDKLPASGSETLLQPDEIKQIIKFTGELPRRFPPITDDKGNPAPADIEFGFLGGDLRLFQIRPFLESRKARGSAYLSGMDRALEGSLKKNVDMRKVPGS